MLSIISDLHITDESTASNVHPTAWAMLESEILSQKKDDDKEIHIVLLGDIFDMLRSDYWLRKNIPADKRPWGGIIDSATGMNTDSAMVEQQFTEILSDILSKDSATAFITAITNVALKGNVPAKLSYVIGNHDKVLNNFPSLKKMIADRFAAFPSQINFCEEIMEPAYRVYARHGHEWDTENYGWHFLDKVLNPGNNYQQFDEACYRVMAIGEVITAELMGGLIYHLKQNIQDEQFISELMDVNNVRPMIDVFLWLEWFSRKKESGYQNILLDALRKSIDGVLQSSLAKKWDGLVKDIWLFKGDITDRLSQIADFIRNRDFDAISTDVRFFKIFEPLFTSKKDDFVEGARSEFLRLKAGDDIQYILFGHTHEARHDYFSSDPSGRVNLYINTGTFLPLITRAANGKDFVKEYQMTFACFHARNEDMNGKLDDSPTLDIWNGIKRKNYKAD